MYNPLVFTLNCGSSSIKFAVINSKENQIVLSGLVDFLGFSEISISWVIESKKYNQKFAKPTSYIDIIGFIACNILKKDLKIYDYISCIGHRVVHGGSNLKKSEIITKETIQNIKNASFFAPLHNPINLLGIQASSAHFPHLKKKI